MKPNSTIVGLLIGLIGGLFVHVMNTSSSETRSIIIGSLLIIPTAYVGIKYRIKAVRDERLTRNGLNHYRQHIHHRRLIKKTS